MPSSIPVAGQQPIVSGRKITAPVVAHPRFGAVTVSGGDQVRFGARDQRVEDASGTAPTTASTATGQPAQSPEQAAPPPPSGPKYGYAQNNIRAGAGFFFRDIVPVLLSLPLLGGFPGFLLAMACVPISYLSGKFGRRIAKDVDHNTLNPMFKYMSSVGQVLSGTSTPDGQVQPVADRLNHALDSAFDLRNAGPIKKALLGVLSMTPGSRMDKLLTGISQSRALLRAEVNIRVAQQDTVGGAGKAAVKGATNWAFYSTMSAIGNTLSKCWWPLSWIGEMMKYAGMIKITSDVMSSSGQPAQPQAPTATSTTV